MHITLLNDDSLSAKTMIKDFNSLLDVFIDDQSLYLLESGSSNGSGRAIYQVSFSGTTSDRTYADAGNLIKINPNPTEGIMRFEFESPEPLAQIKLFNLLGQQQTISYELSSNTIDISKISPGTYVLSFRLESGHHLIKKIVKI